MITGGSTLDPGFPTWGTMLREHGYHTRWYGKWHLTHRDNQWTPRRGERALERYGFAGGIYPSPDGAPGPGLAHGPAHRAPVRRVVRATRAAPSRGARRCRSSTRTTSPGGTCGATACRRGERARTVAQRCRPTSRRPSCWPRATSRACSARCRTRPPPRSGRCRSAAPKSRAAGCEFLDLYAKLQREVDRHIGHVLHTLAQPPAGRREHGRSCSPPTTASTAARTGCAARARAPTRRRSACR